MTITRLLSSFVTKSCKQQQCQIRALQTFSLRNTRGENNSHKITTADASRRIQQNYARRDYQKYPIVQEKESTDSPVISNNKTNSQNNESLIERIENSKTLNDLLLIFQQEHKTEFRPSHISTCWNKATDFIIGNEESETNPEFFLPLIEHTITIIKDCNEQEISNILWSNAVMNTTNPETIAPIFSHLSDQYNDKKITLAKENLYQIYQAYLWFTCEHGQTSVLPNSLLKECIMAFATQENIASDHLKDVLVIFKSLGFKSKEDLLCPKTGYGIDAVITHEDSPQVAIVADGPTHFVDYNPTGNTILKHRQLGNLGDRPILVVPYWEWNQITDGQRNEIKRKEEYLQRALDSLQDNE